MGEEQGGWLGDTEFTPDPERDPHFGGLSAAKYFHQIIGYLICPLCRARLYITMIDLYSRLGPGYSACYMHSIRGFVSGARGPQIL